MKKLLVIICFLSTLVSQSAQWTFHGCKDNYSAVTWSYATGYYWTMSWDWLSDQFYDLDSGTRIIVTGISDTGYSGYSDSLTMDIPDGTPFITCMCTSGYPDYNGIWSNVPFPTIPGEYWLDMDSAGNPRISATQPADFGKWAWDGSINPNYVEPIAPLKSTRGKHLGKQVK